MPKHFTSRTDMVEWLIDNCPRPSIVRALQANRVEFLGGFTKIPPSNLPGWIFVVKLSGKTKNVVILANNQKLKYEIRIVKCVPWEHWSGMWHGVLTTWSWITGDKPEEYKEKYNAAR